MRRRLLTCLGFLALALLFRNTPVQADYCTEGSASAYIFLTQNPQEPWTPGPCATYAPAGTARFYVRALANPFRKIRFVIPDPTNVQVTGESWGVSFTGNHATGTEVDMGNCTAAGMVTIGYMDVTFLVPPVPDACVDWNFAADAEVQDCHDEWRPVAVLPHRLIYGSSQCDSPCYWQACYSSLAPYDLWPPNGAVVSTTTHLTWNGTPPDPPPPPYSDPSTGCFVAISTNPNCLAVGAQIYKVQCSGHYFSPPLQPYTTYYWRIYYVSPPGCFDSSGGTSPTYSFTTDPTVSTQPSSWGYVKSLYRD